MAIRQKPVHKAASNEARAAGDEKIHALFPFQSAKVLCMASAVSFACDSQEKKPPRRMPRQNKSLRRGSSVAPPEIARATSPTSLAFLYSADLVETLRIHA